jgi:hypothetical protein
MVTLKDFARQLKPEERVPEYENDPGSLFYKEILPQENGNLLEVPVLLCLMGDGSDVLLTAFGPDVHELPRAKVLALLDTYTFRTPFYNFFVKKERLIMSMALNNASNLDVDNVRANLQLGLQVLVGGVWPELCALVASGQAAN